MAIFTVIVKRDGEVGYTASFPDFPSCAVAAPTVEVLEPPDDAAARQRGANEERSVEAKVDDITAELVRLLEEGSQSQPERGAGVDTSPQREKQDNLTESISFYWAAREWVA